MSTEKLLETLVNKKRIGLEKKTTRKNKAWEGMEDGSPNDEARGGEMGVVGGHRRAREIEKEREFEVVEKKRKEKKRSEKRERKRN